MTIYIDITQLEKGRANTGIQRVVKEFVKRASASKDVDYKIIIENEDPTEAKLIDNDEIKYFLNDIKNYKFKYKKDFDLLSLKPTSLTAFFDLDATWNIVLKREILYPLLKSNGFLIFNFIYDLIPILMPDLAHETTAKNFRSFINAVYENSDLVMFDSYSAQSDFLKIKNDFKINRNIPTRAIGLGSDFLKTNNSVENSEIINVLDKKYILFVGTIEPRKNQANVLKAFEEISEKYPDLNLVFIGKKGWKVESLIQKILTHPLKDNRLFWFDDIDDGTLSRFYQNAFIVTYLSKYEGYGLPVAESLSYGNVTVTSKNSSMYEVGKNFADYVVYDSLNELESLITLYYENKNLYTAKRDYIKDNFKATSWEQFYASISDIFKNFEKSIAVKKTHLDKLQFVFISIDKHNLQGTIESIDKYVDFVKEYIIVTQPKLIDTFKSISSKHKIILIDEEKILGKYKKDFAKRDHQSKNWLLRASLLNLDILDEEFIMLDDDNRPLKEIKIDKFIHKNGSYSAYYFYYLLDWHNYSTEYDKGQQNMKQILAKENYELLSYSSHAPQIINKSIFKEAVEKFFDIGLKIPIDEWSIYFNYAVSIYPCSFDKKVYETLSWPANQSDWSQRFSQKEVSFENYYKSLYDIDFFNLTDTYEQKVQKHVKQRESFVKTEDMFKEYVNILSKNNMVHKTSSFINKDMEFYLSNLPYFVIVEENSSLRINLNYKLLNLSNKKLDISLVSFLDGNYRTLRPLNGIKEGLYQESIVEFPVISNNLPEGIYDLSLNILVNNSYFFNGESPYHFKLIVVKDKDPLKVLGNPDIIQEEESETVREKTLKEAIKSIPFIGWLSRWTYNLLRLNNLKHTVFRHSQQIQNLQEQINKIIIDNDNLNKKMKQTIAKEIFYQSMSFQQRIDQFLFDAKMKLDSNSSKQLPDSLNFPQDFLDNYYISFENEFRGSREAILERSKEYLKYFDKSKVEKALDLGCGRGEW